MNEKPKYIYITYPIPIEEADNLPIPGAIPPLFEPTAETDFVPLWFGNAKFPEDE